MARVITRLLFTQQNPYPKVGSDGESFPGVEALSTPCRKNLKKHFYSYCEAFRPKYNA